ncbi:MAG TPA: flagellar biosynthetic protein FliO [Armatimonadota bacterium]|nr:flagellar biosynthetic protein FliO [Armatimonadota bacterium]HOQ28850.1 flagellar biosynthetic protein FliO [Armatimonadota bacterium]
MLRDRSGQAPEGRRRCASLPACIPAAWTQMRDLLAANPALRKRVMIGAAAMGILVLAYIGGAFRPSDGRGQQAASPAANVQAAQQGSSPVQGRLPASPLTGRPEDEIPLDLTEASASPEKGGGLRLVGWLFGVALKLGVVLALAYVCLSLLKRFMPGAAATDSDADVGIRRTIVLGAGRTIHLLDVEGHRLLIGCTPQQISLLADLTGAVAPEEEVEGELDTSGQGAESFRAQLGALLEKQEASQPAPERKPVAAPEATPEVRVPGPETYTDEELREEVRRRLFTLNRSAAGLQRLAERAREGEQERWPGS